MLDQYDGLTSNGHRVHDAGTQPKQHHTDFVPSLWSASCSQLPGGCSDNTADKPAGYCHSHASGSENGYIKSSVASNTLDLKPSPKCESKCYNQQEQSHKHKQHSMTDPAHAQRGAKVSLGCELIITKYQSVPTWRMPACHASWRCASLIITTFSIPFNCNTQVNHLRLSVCPASCRLG